MSDSAVRVAVRVRPFNDREQQEGAELCVEMEGKMTRIFNNKTNFTKEYYFDYSYWSHDGCKEDPETKILYKDSPASKYADQQTVFKDLGMGVLDNAWEGYHCCLFAYGQTGSGKSYSMVGYGPNKGIIPIACEEIFNRITNSANQNIEFKVTASMLEIYNEQVQDLLQPPMGRVNGGLRVRNDPKTGIFVEGITKESVATYEEISAILDKGNKHRTVAATQMNATSSRAHTVLTIYFTQIFYDEGSGKQLNRKESNINLVDLAGSERAGKTGASGDRLQEGSNINKSLSTLGKVITALAKKSSGQLKKNEVIPYRESKLTRILQDALGGNSKTTMIAAISPATFNFEETLGTLRYADAVKSIKNNAIVNETPQEKLIRELKEQNEQLKAMLGGAPLSTGGERVVSDVEKQKYERMIEELKRAKEDAEKTWSQRTEEQKQQRVAQPLAQVEEEITTPYIANLNEDPLLSGYIKHAFSEGRNRIGNSKAEVTPDIRIDGLGIGTDHCTVTYQGESCRIMPTAGCKTTINGKPLEEEKDLQHNDRIKFGNHNFFIFKDPEEIDSATFDWQFAVSEANEEQVKLLLGVQGEELKRKEDEFKQKLQAEMEEARRKIEEEKALLVSLQKDKQQQDSASQKALIEKEQEILKKEREMEEELRKKERALKTHDDNLAALEQLKKILTVAVQQINEANERAVLMDKKVIFQPELYRESGHRSIGTGLQNTNVRVRVIYPDLSEDFQIHWSLDKLDRRLIDMQEIFNQLSYGANPAEVDLGYDPFSDKVELLEDTYQLIGHAYIYTDIVYYLIGVEEDLVPIIDDKGSRKGQLRIAVTPVLSMANSEEVENLKEVLGKNLELTVRIDEAIELPENLSTGVYCQYNMAAFEHDEDFTTEKCEEYNVNPKFSYSKEHSLLVNEEAIEEFLNSALTISVYGDISREKREEELGKLKVYQERDREAMSGLSPHMLNPEIDYNELSYHDESLQLSEDAGDLSFQLQQKDLALLQLKNEQQEREGQYKKRVHDIQQREQELSAKNKGRKGSCACTTF